MAGIDTWTSRPICCPFCCGSDVRGPLVAWRAQSTDPVDSDNEAVVDEYQCEGECEGRSFWC